jgi:hypothetical protein
VIIKKRSATAKRTGLISSAATSQPQIVHPLPAWHGNWHFAKLVPFPP